MDLYNIAIAGDAVTGRASIFYRFITGEFSVIYEDGAFSRDYYSPCFATSTIKTSAYEEPIKILLRGHRPGERFPEERLGERFQPIERWFREIKGLILVYDVTRKRSFIALSNWLDESLPHSTDFPVAIVGNKVDLIGEDAGERSKYVAGVETIDSSYGIALAEEISDEYNVPTLFMETSAKTGHNIQRLFSEFAEMVANHWRKDSI